MNRSKQLLSKIESSLVVDESVKSYLKIAELDLLESVLEDVANTNNLNVHFKYDSTLVLNVDNLNESNYVSLVNEIQKILEDSGLDVVDSYQSDTSYRLYLQLSEESCQVS